MVSQNIHLFNAMTQNNMKTIIIDGISWCMFIYACICVRAFMAYGSDCTGIFWLRVITKLLAETDLPAIVGKQHRCILFFSAFIKVVIGVKRTECIWQILRRWWSLHTDNHGAGYWTLLIEKVVHNCALWLWCV